MKLKKNFDRELRKRWCNVYFTAFNTIYLTKTAKNIGKLLRVFWFVIFLKNRLTSAAWDQRSISRLKSVQFCKGCSAESSKKFPIFCYISFGLFHSVRQKYKNFKNISMSMCLLE